MLPSPIPKYLILLYAFFFGQVYTLFFYPIFLSPKMGFLKPKSLSTPNTGEGAHAETSNCIKARRLCTLSLALLFPRLFYYPFWFSEGEKRKKTNLNIFKLLLFLILGWVQMANIPLLKGRSRLYLLFDLR